MAQETLAEPVSTAVNSDASANIPGMGNNEMQNILAEASRLMSASKKGQSASESVRQDMRKAEDEQAPAKQEQKQEAPKNLQPNQQTESGLPTPDREVKKPHESSIDQPKEDGSAIEAFRQDINKGRQDKFRDQARDKQRTKEEVVDEQPAKAETKAEVKTIETPAEQPVTMDEIEKELANPNLSKRHQERMKFLAAQAKKATDLETKVKDLETKAGTATSQEEFNKIKDRQEAAEKELLKYRRRFELESDPEIKKNYDDVIKSADEGIIEKLKGHLSEKTIDLVNKMGGFSAFANSSQMFQVPVTDENGETVSRPITASNLARQWLNSLPLTDSKYIEAKMIERVNKSDEKTRRMAELAADAENHFKGQQEAQKKAFEAQQAAGVEASKRYENWAIDWQKKQDWMKEKEGDEEHNKIVNEARQLLVKTVSVKNIDEVTELAGQLASVPYYKSQLARMQKENEELKQKVSGLGQAVRTTPRPGGSSLAASSRSTSKEKTVKDQMSVSALDSFKSDMEKLRAGGGQYNADEE